MNMQQLRYAVEVAKTGSISKAAENLYMGQPNLSKAIKELEGELNYPIFTRTTKGATLTPKGQEFLRHAKSILAKYEEIEAIGQTDAEKQSFHVSVPRSSYIAEAFTDFVGGLSMEKDLDLDFMETNSVSAIRHVADGDSHLGIIRYDAANEPYFLNQLVEKRLAHRELWAFEYLLLMSERHPLAEKAQVDRDDLLNHIEIRYGDLSVPYRGEALKKPGEAGGKIIYVYERGSQFDLLNRVPRTYMWVSPMPADLLARNALVQRPCPGGALFKDVLIWPKGHKFTPLEKAFVKQVDATVERAGGGPSGKKGAKK